MNCILKQTGDVPTWAGLGFKDGLFHRCEHYANLPQYAFSY